MRALVSMMADVDFQRVPELAEIDLVGTWKYRTGDVRNVLRNGWDLLVAHPPCTYLTLAGARWLYEDPTRWQHMIDAAVFFRELLTAPIPRVAVENPIMHKYGKTIIGRGPDQIIQPWMFGHGETKATGLWLKNLPKLEPTNIVSGREPRVHHASPGPDRWKERSRTLQGIADAMAEQWGALGELDVAA